MFDDSHNYVAVDAPKGRNIRDIAFAHNGESLLVLLDDSKYGTIIEEWKLAEIAPTLMR